MGLIKEPLEIDFVVDSRALTRKGENAISEFIRSDKERRKRKRLRSRRITTRDKQKKIKVTYLPKVERKSISLVHTFQNQKQRGFV